MVIMEFRPSVERDEPRRVEREVEPTSVFFLVRAMPLVHFTLMQTVHTHYVFLMSIYVSYDL
jgi:hypothetical protein